MTTPATNLLVTQPRRGPDVVLVTVHFQGRGGWGWQQGYLGVKHWFFCVIVIVLAGFVNNYRWGRGEVIFVVIPVYLETFDFKLDSIHVSFLGDVVVFSWTFTVVTNFPAK